MARGGRCGAGPPWSADASATGAGPDVASSPAMRVAVVGHVEWCEFAQVPHVPRAGEIVHATRTFEEPGGGGAVAAVQLRKLAGSATLFTAFGDDEVGHRSHAELVELGLDVEGGFRPETQRRAFVHLDESGERTITVLGPRLGPRGADALAWEKLDETDAVYLDGRRRGGGQAGAPRPRARRHAARDGHARRGARGARRARVERTRPGRDLQPGRPRPGAARGRAHARRLGRRVGDRHRREGALGAGGRCRGRFGTRTGRATASPPVSPTASGAGWEIDRAVELAARCGAACMTGSGPYEAQLTL